MTDSPCYPPETITTLLISYTPIQNKIFSENKNKQKYPKTSLFLSVYKNQMTFILIRWLQDTPELQPHHLFTILGCSLISFLLTIPYPNYICFSTLSWNDILYKDTKYFSLLNPQKLCCIALWQFNFLLFVKTFKKLTQFSVTGGEECGLWR